MTLEQVKELMASMPQEELAAKVHGLVEACELAANILMNAGQRPVPGNNLFIIDKALASFAQSKGEE